MKILLGIVQILICLALICVVMMQHRKSGGFSGAFGAGTQADMNSGTWQRMTGLTKVTAVLIALFMILSILQVVVR